MALALEKNHHYTWEDSMGWSEDDRIELIYGEPFYMEAPLRVHQEISGALYFQLYGFLEGKPCRVYHAPFDVRLFAKREDRPRDVDTVVQPDLCVVCDSEKLDKYGCAGAPDFIIEILSPTMALHDRRRKFRLYEKAGVREYWIVDPGNRTVRKYTLYEGRYDEAEVFLSNSLAVPATLEGCEIDLSRVFPET